MEQRIEFAEVCEVRRTEIVKSAILKFADFIKANNWTPREGVCVAEMLLQFQENKPLDMDFKTFLNMGNDDLK